MFRKLLFLLFLGFYSQGQNQIQFQILDSESKEPLPGANVLIKGTNIGESANFEGYIILNNVPNGIFQVQISFVGYQSKSQPIEVPNSNASIIIYLEEAESTLEEIYVEATRANKTISNLPTRTEVLTDEIDEAASMEPGRVSHLLTHTTGVQVQTTSATSNGAVVRIQGLNGRYTQLLRDGFPLYGGFSGSLDIMQIPPLDLRQVEFVKGSASTLYGGGAIGGLVNMLTKKAEKDETLLHLNYSHIGARDFNAFVSRREGKFGFTNLASLHIHNAYDADDDGFSDVPEIAKFAFNPKFFYNPSEGTEMYLGASITVEKRMGGAMALIANQAPNNENYYFDRQNSNRYSSQLSLKHEIGEDAALSFKNSISYFDRYVNIRQNAFGVETQFAGQQFQTWNELSYNYSSLRQNLVLGANLSTDNFDEDDLGQTTLRDQNYVTVGLFANHLWDVNDVFSLESGLRADYALSNGFNSENEGETFILPRLNALYKFNRQWSLRLGGGLGYRMPTLFNEEAEPLGYNAILPVDFANLVAERSYGSNFDIKYQSNFGTDWALLTYNLMLFYNVIDNPITLVQDLGSLNWEYLQIEEFQNSRGFESQIKLQLGKIVWFVGYTYSYAAFETNDLDRELILTPRHSIKGDLLFVEDGKWRIGWDYEYKSGQLLSSNFRTRDLFTTGIIVERTLNNFVLFLNAENFTDVRQTRYESLVGGPYNTPQFADIWAPLDGFFFNAGLKISL